MTIEDLKIIFNIYKIIFLQYIMRGHNTLSDVNTFDGDEKKAILSVPKSTLVKPLIKLKSTL